MRHKQLAIDKMNICLETAEPAFKSIQQGTRVFVIVVSVSPNQGHWSASRAGFGFSNLSTCTGSADCNERNQRGPKINSFPPMP